MTLHPRLKEIIRSSRFSTIIPEDLEDTIGNLVAIDVDAAANIGINVRPGSTTPIIFVTDAMKYVGNVDVNSIFDDTMLYFDNRESRGQLFASINMHGEQAHCVFEDAGKDYVALHILNMRSHRQNFYLGKKSTAVGLSIEMEGEDTVCVVGEDALISSGVWLRNHDMHSVVDLKTGRIVNSAQGDILIERHVWLGQDVLAVGDQHIGFGTIIGARSFLKKPIPPKCIAAGTPARVLKENMSWGRLNGLVSEAERAVLEELSATAS
ncbi:hypothetical protein FSB78_02115 [Sphingomonas ginsenosidivorax]|uniref:Acyltransferase n=1 Tax=Sphingomonas ginsenosidivorax TaxID=862135 RepID=A0A5C6UCQ3_9SPHN|nr:hypothetical protein [Sphingomonas ginsenosidivorax]TXC69886.1 hypothetical protein FSB78_02115 [Sphingomonas ginsenosidivorax]